MQAIILAAGQSSRFWPLNQKHKSLIKIMGRPLIYWTIKGLAENGIKDIAIIISPDPVLKEELKTIPQDLNVNLSYFIQKKRLGTGNAISLAEDFIKEPFFIVWGAEVAAREVVAKILEEYQLEGPSAILVGAKTNAPWDYGIFKLEGKKVLEIVENPRPGQEPSQIKTVGIYFLEPDFFNYYQDLLKHHEADFVDALNFYIKDKKTKVLFWPKEMFSLKYPWDLLAISKIILESENSKNYISPSATIGENVVIKGKVYIGDNCQIGHNNVLRGPLNLENNVKTGAFCEIKNSVVQEETHFHSGYIGDSVIGQNCRFGAGFITANRRIDRQNIKSTFKGKKIDTGLTYLGTMAGNNVCFGVHSATMPGVLIGSNCVIGPATLIFENLGDNTTFFAEFKGIKKWRKNT
jgi:bifunctional UDP-N-acetylglucosamine pyrophosphorylase/glucosamine-1-phosphate N-acetyltransferase